MSDMSVHFSSEFNEWETPLEFFRKLDAEFHFETDVCALASNTKCAKFITPEQDGLKTEWRGICWMNPPYGEVIGKWVRRAFNQSCKGATVVCLVPARTDTAWWHDWATRAEIRFIRGRLKFGGGSFRRSVPICRCYFSRK